MKSAAFLLAALPALALAPSVRALAPALLQEDREGGQGESGQDARSDKEKEQARMDEEARKARMGKEALIREAEEARRKGLAGAEAVRATPMATLIVTPRLVLAGSPTYLTVTRFDPTPQPGAPAPTAGQPILPQHVVLQLASGEERRLEPALAARPVPPGVDPPGVLPPGAVRKTFDIGKALEGTAGGTITLRYETPGGQPAFATIRALTQLKGFDPEKVDPKTVYLLIETDLGLMVAEFLTDKAPNTIRHFLRLVSQGFYDGLTFHRIVKQFMVQGGDPASGGKTYKGEPIAAEFNDVPHRKGVLAMARGADPDSATCQFFIVHRDHAFHLDKGYTGERAFPTTGFARLVDGFEALERLASVPVKAKEGSEEMSVPEKPPVILRIALAEKFAGPAAPSAAKPMPPAPGATPGVKPQPGTTRPARPRG